MFDVFNAINEIKIENNRKIIENFITKEWEQKLLLFINNINIIPKESNVFRCFNYFDISKTKVVLLGQDPYPNSNDACGLAFSVERKENLPKSLTNIFKELESDLNVTRINGNLENWAEQGILLLNAALTFVDDQSRQAECIKLWKQFTKYTLSKIIGKNKNVIFLILGKKAEETCEGLNIKNKIITSHPSPLGYTKGFKNSKIFSRVNEILKNEDEQLIEW